MFQKPAFGTSNTSSFGSFNAGSSAASPFGGFKAATATSAFGAPPAFGAAAAPQPTAGPGLFGSSTTSGGLFGNTAASTSAPAFGATSGAFSGFGASTSTNTLFNSSSGGGLFGAAQNTQAFGAKPAGFGFGATPTPAPAAGGLFGAAPAPAAGLFPAAQSNAMSGGGLFNTTSAFGQQQTQSGTGHVKYNPVVGTDVIVKSGTSQNINIKHHCITCMKEYENKSLEELRLEDYTAGRKGAPAGGMFGGFAQPQENKPLFGGSTFGQPAATTSSSVFGGTHQGFLSSGGTFSFGNTQPAQTSTTSLFGAAKPAFGAPSTTGGGLFGATTTQAPAFGTNTSSFGFSNTTQNQSSGLFGAKPAAAFGGAAPAAGFGGFGGGAGLFQAKPQPAPAFGAQAPAFGGLSSSFGAAPAPAGGLFSGAAFGKPAAPQPSVGFNTQPQPGLGGLGANAFQAKPGAAPFGTLGGGSIFNQQQPANNFLSKPEGGLGGGMFGSSFGAPSLGMAMNNSTQLTNNTLSGSSAAGNVHEQILTLAARPYGDSPLFKHLLPENSTTAEDVLKPTNPAAVKAILDSSAAAAYRVTSPGARLRLQPRPDAQDKKSLFDGLEESDASLEDKLSLKPSRKRLVLRPNQRNDSLAEEQSRENNRSVEEQSIPSPGAPRPAPAGDEPDAAARERRGERSGERSGKRGGKRSGDFDYNLDVTADKSNYWDDQAGGGSPNFQPQWNDKEKPIDGEPTPRLYPNLDKEVNTQTSERRASWLTTKALRKPAAASAGGGGGAGGADSAEQSVRELGVRALANLSDKENRDSRVSYTDTIRDGSRISNVSEEENVPPVAQPPHRTGVRLSRPGYYTIPSLDEMIAYMRPDGSCVVPHLTIGRHNYGNVFYDCEIDVAGLDIDALVHFLNKEVIIYPEDADKPPVGQGLNRRAIVTLDRVWPRDKTQKRAITDPARLIKMEYESKLRRVCDKHDTKFIEYRPQTGSWVFRVEHFSKYGLTDSDEEDEGPTPDVLKRQLVKEAVQKSAALPAPKPVAVPSPGLGGLGGVGGLGLASGLSGGLSGGLVSLGGGLGASEDTLLAMHQTSLNLLNGAGKAFEMDTTEDNAESQSLYQDNRAFGVKSPTSELARLEHRQSHHVQLMKASLYADTEMEDDISISTGDQLVPISTIALPTRAPSAKLSEHEQAMEDTPPADTDEVQMPTLIVPPHTIVLKYHRKVPPYSKTIAGRLGASHLADVSLWRARHSRVGFGPRATLAYVTSAGAVADLPKNAELCDLGKYVCGRSDDDWSEAVVTRLALAHGDHTPHLQEALSRHLETLLEYSDLVSLGEGQCPMLKVKQDPKQRRELLNKQLRDAQASRDAGVQFGVSSKYCYEVWKLCDALWGADLDNDGVPGNDVASIVNRHRRLLDWMKDAVAEVTDDELSKPSEGEEEDEEDGRVWTLLLGGRVREACGAARRRGDLHLAMLLAQAAGPPAFRNLVSRQLSLWRECGAEPLIPSWRAAALRLVAGQPKPLDKLLEVDWLRALHATQRYLCPQVPTLERVIRTYESFFSREGSDDEVDLTTVEADEMGLKLPVPPYMANEDIRENGNQRRVLDLRYELIRARALNTRPKLRPEAYTADPLDYSLAFLVGAWLGGPAAESVAGFAAQLAARGLWHRAAQALAYHPDHAARGHLIRAVLSRHAPAQADSPELRARLQQLQRLRLPAHWLQLAMAHRAKYENLPRIEAEHLADAGQWNAAHKVLLEQLLPEAVLADDLESIAPLLEKMNDAASRHLVSGWERGGQALYHYLHVCMEIRGLVSGAEAGSGSGGVPERLEALRPRVAAACRALKQLSTNTPRLAAARAEMGARLVQLALAGGEPAHHLAALLRALQLPPDCTAAASHKITTELAERASDSCAASLDSSPLSHRTAMLS